MLNTADLWLHIQKNIQFSYTIIVQQSSNITITFSFIHTGLIKGHKHGSVNLEEFHAAVTQLSNVHISVLAHCLAGGCQHHSMEQVDEASLAPVFSSTSW